MEIACFGQLPSSFSPSLLDTYITCGKAPVEARLLDVFLE